MVGSVMKAAAPEAMWRELDAKIQGWWDADVVDPADPATTYGSATMIDVPRAYVAAGTDSSPDWYRTMFDWDGYFTCLGLFVHGRHELVRDLIENYLHLVDLFGYMPNGNQVEISTRSQPPVFPDAIARYLQVCPDFELAARVYPTLVREYRGYWLADHHQTPTGLATCRDLGDVSLDPRLAAEAETGLDWTSLYDGDVRNTVPLVVNCALVRYAEVLSTLAVLLDRLDEAAAWRSAADERAALIRSTCWNADAGFFYDFDYVHGRFVRDAGATGYWPLWAGVATADQARGCAAFLPRLLHPYGITTTETAPERAPFGDLLDVADLQWTHPAGWPPLQLMTTWGLSRYGLHDAARTSATGNLDMMVHVHARTGQLYEKYNIVDGTTELPNSRYGSLPLHGWTSAAVALLGRYVHEGTPIEAQLPPLTPTDTFSAGESGPLPYR